MNIVILQIISLVILGSISTSVDKELLPWIVTAVTLQLITILMKAYIGSTTLTVNLLQMVTTLVSIILFYKYTDIHNKAQNTTNEKVLIGVLVANTFIQLATLHFVVQEFKLKE